MPSKVLLLGIILLLLSSILNPLTIGWNVEKTTIGDYSPYDDKILRNIEYMLTTNEKPSNETMDYYREKLQYATTKNSNLQTPNPEVSKPSISLSTASSQ